MRSMGGIVQGLVAEAADAAEVPVLSLGLRALGLALRVKAGAEVAVIEVTTLQIVAYRLGAAEAFQLALARFGVSVSDPLRAARLLGADALIDALLVLEIDAPARPWIVEAAVDG